MQSVQGASSDQTVTSHAMFLANVSRHFVSLEIEPMLEAVGRATLCILGDICVVDRLWGAAPTRILEVRATPDAWMETPADLAAVSGGEVRVEGNRSRISVPIGAGADRYGLISFARNEFTALQIWRSRRNSASAWRWRFATFASTAGCSTRSVTGRG
jgi:hypothetical protein